MPNLETIGKIVRNAMRLKSILCFAALSLFINVQAQDLKIQVNNKGKVGFVDKNGLEVIKCQYDGAQPFKNGFAIVTKSGKQGIIDEKGTVLLPLKYTQISTWNKDLLLVKDGKKMGLAKHSGVIVLPIKYSHISKTNCYDKALIALGGKVSAYQNMTYMSGAKYGIIDNNGKILVTPKYPGLYEFSFDGSKAKMNYEGKRLQYSYHFVTDTLITDCKYLGFTKNGLSIAYAGIMDENGKEILKAGLYYFVMLPQSNMVRYYEVKRKETLCGYHNLSTGKGFQAAKFSMPYDDITFWTHGDFIGDIAPVNGDKWSFIDKTGKTIRTNYSLLKHSASTKLWAAKNSSEKWDVFDDQNNDVSALSGYDDINLPIHEGDAEIFSVKKGQKYGCINRQGETKVPFEYDNANSNVYDMIPVSKDGKWGMITPENVSLVPTEYVNIALPTERKASHLWVQKSDSLYYHFNVAKQEVAETGYKAVDNFKDGIAHVIPVGMELLDTPVNRAQLFVPNTPCATIINADFTKGTRTYGYLLNTEDELLIDLPVSSLYIDAVVKELKKLGNRKPTQTEKKAILLYVTRENRSYDMKSTISEDEWNY